MKAPRVKAQDVCVGDLILTCYHPRTWKPVEVVECHPTMGEAPIMIDTAGCRTWWNPDELVPCKRRGAAT